MNSTNTMNPMNPYKNGYLPKIAYHTAANNPEKVEYFTNRQIEVYGRIDGSDLSWIANEVYLIKKEWAQEMAEFNSHLG